MRKFLISNNFEFALSLLPLFTVHLIRLDDATKLIYIFKNYIEMKRKKKDRSLGTFGTHKQKEAN